MLNLKRDQLFMFLLLKKRFEEMSFHVAYKAGSFNFNPNYSRKLHVFLSVFLIKLCSATNVEMLFTATEYYSVYYICLYKD